MARSTLFESLEVGQSFDFIDDANPMNNSFFLRCRKISHKKYRDTNGDTHRVGTIKCAVFHVLSVEATRLAEQDDKQAV